MLEMMYMIALIAGGGLVVVSSFAGGFGADADLDVDADLAIDADMDPELDVDGADFGDLSVFLKFKFWTFFFAFFGLSGFLLTKLGTSAVLSFLVALVVGVLAGFSMSWTLEKLKSRQRGSHATLDNLLGRDAVVQTAVRGDVSGSVRVELGGRTIDLIANSEVEDRIEAGEKVTIVAFESGRARVVPEGFLS